MQKSDAISYNNWHNSYQHKVPNPIKHLWTRTRNSQALVLTLDKYSIYGKTYLMQCLMLLNLF